MLENLIKKMQKEYIDGFFISNPYNVQYISGFREKFAYALITKKGKYILTDGRHKEIASKTTKGFEIINWQQKENKLKQAVDEIIKKEGVKRLGFEAEHLTYKKFTELYDMVDAEITPVIGLVEQLRVVKTEEEIQNLKKASQINDRVFKRLLKNIKTGKTEKEISALCNYYIRLEGGDTKISENIFLTGSRSSQIMASPSDAEIKEGDLFLINYGASYKGYLTDFSRTVIVGKEPTPKQKEAYEVVKKAQMEAIKSIKAGVLAKEPFYASEKIFIDTGYRENHYEGMGHGIGLFLHEEPFLDKNSKLILEKNNVLTVEPGLYIPDWGGIRIEDTVLVTEEGYELLTKSPRELIVI
ncbi:MAG: Xaa-Pro peptidase family protein [Eubacteriales bacterium]